jgi:hypothetical protein
MNTGSGVINHFRDHLIGFVCDVLGHNWAGSHDHEARSDGLLLCMRCGYEADRAPKPRQLIALH